MTDKTKTWIARIPVVIFAGGAYWALCLMSPGFEPTIAMLVLGALAIGYVCSQNAYLRGRRDGAAKVNSEIETYVNEVVAKSKLDQEKWDAEREERNALVKLDDHRYPYGTRVEIPVADAVVGLTETRLHGVNNHRVTTGR